MKKITKLLILSLSALTCFSACGNGNNSSSEVVPPSSSETPSSSEKQVDADALIADAADFLWQTYKDINAHEVIATFDLTQSVYIGGEKVTVSWDFEIEEGDPKGAISMKDGKLEIDYFGKLITNLTETFKIKITPTLTYGETSKGLGDAMGKSERNVIKFEVPPIKVGNHNDWIKLAKDGETRITLEGTVVDMIDLNSSSSSKGSFYMIDDEGHGYYVYTPIQPTTPAKTGDRVLVSGFRSDYSGQEEFKKGAAYGVLSSGHSTSLKFKNATADWASAKSTTSSDSAFGTRFETKTLTHSDLTLTTEGGIQKTEVESTNSSYSAKPVATIETDGVYEYTNSSATYFSFHKATNTHKDSIKVTAPKGYTIGSVELVTSGTYDNLDWYVAGKKINESTNKVDGNLVSTGVVNDTEVLIENAVDYFVNSISIKVTLVDAATNYQNNLVELNDCTPVSISGSNYYFRVGDSKVEYNIYDTYYFLSDAQRKTFKDTWDKAWNEGKTLTVKGISTVYSSVYQVYGTTLAPEIITVDGELTTAEKHAYVKELLLGEMPSAAVDKETKITPNLPAYADVTYAVTSPATNASATVDNTKGEIVVKPIEADVNNVITATVTIDDVTEEVELTVSTEDTSVVKYATDVLDYTVFAVGSTSTTVKAKDGSGNEVDLTLTHSAIIDASTYSEFSIAKNGDGFIKISAPEGYKIAKVEMDLFHDNSDCYAGTSADGDKLTFDKSSTSNNSSVYKTYVVNGNDFYMVTNGEFDQSIFNIKVTLSKPKAA